ncbi:MAG: hypothetical protein IKH27_04030 [Oscillospiraceae bacterium]|nr:hypothetical protein [Oscillospiraceae bacterium]
MNLKDFNELLEKYNVEPAVEPTESTPVTDLEIDSFDMMMILGDLENSMGKSLDVTLDTTVGEIMEKMTAAGM